MSGLRLRTAQGLAVWHGIGVAFDLADSSISGIAAIDRLKAFPQGWQGFPRRGSYFAQGVASGVAHLQFGVTQCSDQGGNRGGMFDPSQGPGSHCSYLRFGIPLQEPLQF